MELNPDIRKRLISGDLEGYRDVVGLDGTSFVFQLRDMRPVFGREWGGEFRVCINQNVVLHFVPGFCDEMATPTELPQFTVIASDERDGTDQVVHHPGLEDLDPFEGVLFYVSRETYRKVIDELVAMAGEIEGIPLVPDTLFTGTRFTPLVRDRILSHPVVEKERGYDFSKQIF